MSQDVPVRASATWVALTAATGLTWWLGGDRQAGANSGQVLVAMAIPVAFLKVYLIGIEFMEVRGAPSVLRRVFGAWTVAFGTALTAIYLL